MILDHIEKLEFTDTGEDYLFDAQMTLARLSQGLFWLYDSVVKAERETHRKMVLDNVVVSLIGGEINGVSVNWLSCAFQWYAVSVCNYIRLVGQLTKKDTRFSREYLTRIIPRVVEYRNKVAAHFAMTDPFHDNDADLAASIMTNIVYAHGYLRAGAMSETLVDEMGNEIRVKNKTSWSLTKTHENLISRYWPNGPLDSFNSIRISAGTTRKMKISWED